MSLRSSKRPCRSRMVLQLRYSIANYITNLLCMCFFSRESKLTKTSINSTNCIIINLLLVRPNFAMTTL